MTTSFNERSTGASAPEQDDAKERGTEERSTEERAYVVDRTNRADARFGATGWDESEDWRDRTRIFLTPVAAPSILGLYGFFFSTLLVGTHQAGWWGNNASVVLLFPVSLFLGGLAQFLAGMWSYRARDGLATAMHGIWGGFWLAFGTYNLFVALGVLPPVTPPKAVAFGFWFIAIGAITAMGALASLAESLGLFAVLGPLAAGSVMSAVGYIGGHQWWITIGGWLFVVAAFFAWYTASAMMLQESFGRTILPLWKWEAAANIPGRKPSEPMQYEEGMPGSKVGQ